jgi:hypothetical protein
VAKAAGDWLVFLDDDARPEDAFWLQRILSDAEAHRRAAVWGGVVLHRDSPAREFDGGRMSDYGFHLFQPDAPEPIPGLYWRPAVCGANMAFRADSLREAGGFDEQYIYYAEETDLSWRLQEAGWDAVTHPGNSVRHYPQRPQDLGSILCKRNWRTIVRSDTYFAMRHGRNASPVRWVRVLALAPKKHYLQELHEARRRGLVTPAQWRRAVLQCVWGGLSGLAAALVTGPRLARFPGPFPAFLPFPAARPPQESGSA